MEQANSQMKDKDTCTLGTQSSVVGPNKETNDVVDPKVHENIETVNENAEVLNDNAKAEVVNENADDCVEKANDDNACQEMVADYTYLFTTHEWFETRERLCEWARATGKEHGMVIVISRSDNGGGTKRPRIFLSCERSGQYRDKNKNKNKDADVEGKGKRKRESGTKKCDCPFQLQGKQVGVNQWELIVKCGLHNHPTAEYLEGHSYLGRLSNEEQNYVVDSSIGNSKPKDILFGLKHRFPENKSTIKTVYNARMRNKVGECAGRSEMQQLMHKLQEHGYIHHHRRCETTNAVKDLFFAHPRSLDLMRCFPKVLMMDCTYKTNRYKLPLLEIVGITSTQLTFSIAAVYLEFEREDNYTWALTILRALLSESELPNVIVTDREKALMNALEKTFPTSRHFLCRWHINRNIAANCKKEFRKKEIWDGFLAVWNMIVVADTENEFNQFLTTMESNFAEYPTVLKYVTNNWIVPYKERFISCWTNSVMHFDNTTTNRVESHHAALKKQLGSSQGSFETCWKQIHTLIETCHTAIKASFENSKNVVQHKYKSPIFMLLRGMVSINALNKIYDEMINVSESGFDSVFCNCNMRKTCGLPCSHEIWEYQRLANPIPLEKVDSFWKKLDMTPPQGNEAPTVEGELETRLNTEMEDILITFQQAPVQERLLLLKRLMEVANPVTTSLDTPSTDVLPRVRGRPKSLKVKRPSKSTKRDPSLFEYVDSIKDSCSPREDVVYDMGPSSSSPMFTTSSKSMSKLRVQRPVTRYSSLLHLIPDDYVPYVESITDVAGDGHCGFRSVAEALGFGNDNWSKVRKDLTDELMTHHEYYRDVFPDRDGVEKVLHNLDCDEPTAPWEHWYMDPYTSLVVSCTYNVAVVTLDKRQCCCYLPFRTPPPEENPRLICIANVNQNHYVKVALKPFHPVPNVYYRWETWRLSCAAPWKDIYRGQLNMLNESVGQSRVGPSVMTPITIEED